MNKRKKREQKLTIDEVFGLGDNVLEVAGDMKALIRVGREASADGKVDAAEIAKIAEASEKLVLAAQEFVEELREALED